MSSFSGGGAPDSLQSTPAITIYYRRKRILIHRSTIRALNNPQYVRLLINPREKKLAVQVCDNREQRSFKTPDDLLINPNAAFEITSTALLKMIRDHMGWFEDKTYRLYGQPKIQRSMALFDLNEYYEVNDMGDE